MTREEAVAIIKDMIDDLHEESYDLLVDLHDEPADYEDEYHHRKISRKKEKEN